MSMEAMMREIARMSGNEAPEPRPPALIVEALRDQAQFYARENPFKVGDIVTPRKGTTYRGDGEAHIVIEVNELADYDFTVKDASSTAYGRKPDIRVLSWMKGHWPSHWVESACFEPWVEKAAEAETDSAASEAA